jgi:hypothetical protein
MWFDTRLGGTDRSAPIAPCRAIGGVILDSLVSCAYSLPMKLNALTSIVDCGNSLLLVGMTGFEPLTPRWRRDTVT